MKLTNSFVWALSLKSMATAPELPIPRTVILIQMINASLIFCYCPEPLLWLK